MLLGAGKGNYTWTDGTVYTGDWVRDLKHGNGLLIWARFIDTLCPTVTARVAGSTQLVRTSPSTLSHYHPQLLLSGVAAVADVGVGSGNTYDGQWRADQRWLQLL